MLAFVQLGYGSAAKIFKKIQRSWLEEIWFHPNQLKSEGNSGAWQSSRSWTYTLTHKDGWKGFKRPNPLRLARYELLRNEPVSEKYAVHLALSNPAVYTPKKQRLEVDYIVFPPVVRQPSEKDLLRVWSNYFSKKSWWNMWKIRFFMIENWIIFDDDLILAALHLLVRLAGVACPTRWLLPACCPHLFQNLETRKT